MPNPDRFENIIGNTFKHEGGYVFDPSDPGGETKYGISKRRYPHINIIELTEEQAIEIYRRDYWEKWGYDRINKDEVAAKVFDLSVNVGPYNAHLALQRALRACGKVLAEDGYLGPISISALNSVHSDILLPAYRSEAAAHYRIIIADYPELERYLSGWLIRAYS